MHTIHVILLENYVLFILVFYIVIYLIIPVVIVVLKCIVLISTVLFKVSLLYPEKGLIIENKICHCHCHQSLLLDYLKLPSKTLQAFVRKRTCEGHENPKSIKDSLDHVKQLRDLVRFLGRLIPQADLSEACKYFFQNDAFYSNNNLCTFNILG